MVESAVSRASRRASSGLIEDFLAMEFSSMQNFVQAQNISRSRVQRQASKDVAGGAGLGSFEGGLKREYLDGGGTTE
jgi:hypothetical protein